MKKIISFTLILLALTTLICPISAHNVKTEIEYFEDGSYCVTEIVEEEIFSGLRAISTKSGSKTNRYYSSSGDEQFRLIVSGTFNYNGTVARATSSSYSYGITNAVWSFDGGSSSYTANRATATGTFVRGVNEKTLSVTLYCDQDGNLS